MQLENIKRHIVGWLKEYAQKAGSKGFVVGISGGIDSAVTSALCAETGLELLALSLPIRQARAELGRTEEHMNWLKERYPDVRSLNVDLTSAFEAVATSLPAEAKTALSLANSRSRLRMLTLYAFAGAQHLLVAGTGNKVEDFGVGFFTKYGDGGVDLSPIADLNKTEVYALAGHLELPQSVQNAIPTDGLFDGSPSDEQQLGASYPELEWAMTYVEGGKKGDLNQRQKEVLQIFEQRNRANKHKIEPIPICKIPDKFKS